MSKHDQLAALREMGPAHLRRLFRKRLGMDLFVAQKFVGYWRQSAAAEVLPPYSLTMAWDPDDRIFVVTVPELPGCRTHGTTYEEAAANAREAIASWVGAAKEFGDVLPEPRVERHALGDDAPLFVDHPQAKRGVA